MTGKYDKNIVAKLNAAMRESHYTDGSFQQFTGKGLDELWQEYVGTLK